MGGHQASSLWAGRAAAYCLLVGIMASAIPAVHGKEVGQPQRALAVAILDIGDKWFVGMSEAARDVSCGTTVAFSWSSGTHNVALVEGGELAPGWDWNFLAQPPVAKAPGIPGHCCLRQSQHANCS